MLRAPTEIVIATSDLEAALRHLDVVDLVERSRQVVPADVAQALYGVDTTVTEVVVGPRNRPEVDRGLIRLVTGAAPAFTPHPHLPGPMAVDVYTGDIEATRKRAAEAGVATGAQGRLEAGPLVMHQCEIVAPDGWRLVVVEANHRRPSLLDADEDRLHSEVHSLLWTVSSLEGASAPFLAGGLEQVHVFPFDDPELARILGIEEDEASLRMNLLADDQSAPVRLELVEFVSPRPVRRADAPTARDVTLPSGVHGPLFDVDDIEGTLDSLGIDRAPLVPTEAGRRAVVVTGGVRVHLRSA